MDPQSLAFQPQPDLWQLSTSMRNVQEVQQDHAERLIRLERRNEEETRTKSIWGPSSPFPGVISGTPQHGELAATQRSRFFPSAKSSPSSGPTRHHSTVDFAGFDDDQTSNNMLRSLHLDATDDEPRRLGATSRANSVRFDESANQGQWSHASRTSLDISRTSTGLPGLGQPMMERSSSHKSDGRHSSAGQSVFSGRANSLGLDSTSALSTAPMQPPGLAPGLFVLGAVPSIIRCWLNNNWKHETLLYAAICTGSYKSFLDRQLIEDLDMEDLIGQDINGDQKIKIPLYLPEAVPQPSSSRSSSPAPQLPTVTVDFTVLESDVDRVESKSIRVFVGSDLLAAHNADVLLSRNMLTLVDDERTKLSIPLVRPENEATFKNLYITSGVPGNRGTKRPEKQEKEHSYITEDLRNGALSHQSETSDQTILPDAREDGVDHGVIGSGPGPGYTEDAVLGSGKLVKAPDHDRKPSLGRLSTEQKPEEIELGEPSSSVTSASKTGSSPAIWNNNWRRDGNAPQTNQGDWTNISRSGSRTILTGRSNRDAGIKVLKPSRQASRSSNVPQSASAASPTVTGQSRFFDEGKRRNGESLTPRSATIPDSTLETSKQSSATEASSKGGSKENAQAATKPRSLNPVGGASAFGWLNSGGQEKP